MVCYLLCSTFKGLSKMSNIFRLALCGDTEEVSQVQPEESAEKTIKMTGPLSEVYTKALQVVYAKTDEESGVMAVESQANDAFMQIALRKALAVRQSNVIDPDKLTNGYNPSVNTTVAIINVRDVDSKKILSAANSLITDKLADPDSRNILVVDGGEEETGEFNTLVEEVVDPSAAQVTLRAATENLCKRLGIEVYYSFEAFVEHL